MPQNILLFMVGLVILGVGADLLIRGSAGLARRFGVPPFVIGFAVVGFGTSAPELAVNLSAACGGSCDMALGNIVGSNIANVGLILGTAALVRPLAVHMRVLRFEVPIAIGAALALWALAAGGDIGRAEGAALLAAFAAVAVLVFRSARREEPDVKQELSAPVDKPVPAGRAVAASVLGLAGLTGGAHLMVGAAAALARTWGMSDLAIGLTIVAVGTSLPELASSVAAALRRQPDIAVGNVIGSNIFNILLILGVTASVQPVPVPAAALRVDIPVMAALSVALLPIMWGGGRVSRGEGGLLLGLYASYIAWLVVRGA